MKITDVRTTVVQGWIDWLLIRVDTDEKISGYGDAPMPPGHAAETYEAVIDHTLRPRLLGEDPTNIERLCRKMGMDPRGGVVTYIISSVEMALWDIFGKALDVPTYKLLGGNHRDRIRCYADCHAGKPTFSRESYDVVKNKEIFTPEAYAENARNAKKLGYDFLKFDIYPEVATVAGPEGYVDGHLRDAGLRYLVGILGAVREAIGEDTDLAADFTSAGGYYTVPDAIRLISAFERFNLRWVEDVVSPSNVDALATVTASVRTPTLAGGVLQTRQGFREIIEKQAVRILHPDLSHCGGLAEGKKIHDMAETYYMPVALHNICTPVGTMAMVHAAATMANFLALEVHHLGVPWWDDLVKSEKPIIKKGYIEVPDKPGLGIELNEAEVRKHLRQGKKYFE
ncbi:mandelate racemase/muconate lactonizing enzyme family protein [Candidatus Bathyarchaeota archaeon]|nr:mandelate racemase/muconate lactonizing enzyme family protein [Candidatus Bathyarchaeota archaeon]